MSRPPATTATADPRLPTVFALLAKAQLPVTPATIGLALRAASATLPDAATAVQAWNPDLSVPDVADDDAPAALRAVITALALAGLRPATGATPLTMALPDEPTAPEVVTDPAPATVKATDPKAATAPETPRPGVAPAQTEDEPAKPLLETVARTVARESPSDLGSAALRELAADPVLPPRHLDEYDRVMPLPLLAQGQAAPARLAVASRTSPTGARSTWMRVDCELSRLGPVSVRLSGTEGGPIAITVVAGSRGARAIAAGVPDLVADLQARGLPAAIRVVEEEPW